MEVEPAELRLRVDPVRISQVLANVLGAISLRVTGIPFAMVTLSFAQAGNVLARRDPGVTTLAGGWNGRSFLFPVDDGVIRATLSDATACFNLNSVVHGAGELFTRHETGIAQYQALLLALDFPPAQARALADALADWIDSDHQREGLGHEDPGYVRGRDGYRTGATLLSEPSPCGRTNRRIRGWMGRADQTTKVKGMFVRPEQIAEIARRHPELARLRLVVTRDGEADAMTLKAEAGTQHFSLAEKIGESVQAITKLKGKVELVPPGALPNDGKVIEDARSY